MACSIPHRPSVQNRYTSITPRLSSAYNIVNAALKKAKITGMISSNPCEGVELPKLKQYKAEIYDTDGIQAVLTVTKDTDMYLPVLLCLTLGLRRGELCALRWEHIDFQTQVIHIRENTVLANGKIITKAPKTKAGSRDISIGREVTVALREAQRRYFENRNRLGKAFHDNGYVFCQENGKQYRPDSITQKWERFVADKGLPKIRLHDLRHPYVKPMTKNFHITESQINSLGESAFYS